MSNTNLKKIDSINKKEYYNLKNFYGNDKILVVFFVSSLQDFSDILHITRIMRRKRVITFLVFVKIDESPVLPFCMNPVGNPLGLSRGVSILVKCYEDPVIREWHSTNNEVLIYERATWDLNKGFTSKSRRLVLGAREFLRGKTLLAASIQVTYIMYICDMFHFYYIYLKKNHQLVFYVYSDFVTIFSVLLIFYFIMKKMI